MSNTVIAVQNLSKKYHIGSEKQSQSAVQQITGMFTYPIRRIASLNKTALPQFADEEFWALRDINFEVPQGQVLGIIGRNGAGKSTLLKILSSITRPTEGQAVIQGRVGSLLEVGTGFHGELTGRENIYLNGSILGLSNQEIQQRFDEIVDFSGVETFLDTPIKRYSSGMKVRLAFAVAAHLDPEILLIDEVLSVGDAEFRQKSLNKMNSVTKQGRTVLFISHNLIAIKQICDRVLLLEDGRIVADGDSRDVIDKYLNKNIKKSGETLWHDPKPGRDGVNLCAVRVRNSDCLVTDTIFTDEDFEIEIELEVLQEDQVFNVGIFLFNSDGVHVLTSNDFTEPKWQTTPRSPGIYKSTCHLPANLLNDDRYTITAQLKKMPAQVYAREYEALTFEIQRRRYPGDVFLPFRGVVLPDLEWRTQHDEKTSTTQ